MAGDVQYRVIFNHIPRYRREAQAKTDRALRLLVELGVNYAKDSIRNSPATGRSYRRGGKTHVASSPGNPPRIDTGTLVASIHSERKSHLQYMIVDGVVYGFFLEFGNTRGLLPRPFMGPMAFWLQKQVTQVFRETFR